MICLNRLAVVLFALGTCAAASVRGRIRQHVEDASTEFDGNPEDTPANPMTPFLTNLDASLEDVSNQLRNLPDRVKAARADPAGRELQMSNTTDGDIQIAYLGTVPTKAWVSVPVPYKEAQTMSPTMSFLGFPAVKGHTTGVHTVFYEVLVDLPVGGYLVGDLEPPSAINPAMPAPASFAFSPWVEDDLLRLFPQYDILSNGQLLTCQPPKHSRETDSAAHLMYKIVTRCGGIVIEFYAHVYNGHPVVEWELFGIFSDYSVPNVTIPIDSFSVTFGEFIVVDDHLPLGMASHVGTYNVTTADTWSIVLAENINIGHGQGTPVFKGALLCIDNAAPFETQIRNPAVINAPEWQYILARLDGKILAGRTHWDASWLAFQAAIPRNPQDDVALDMVFNSQWNMMSSPQDLYAQRKLGLNKGAGSTGYQGDFGSQKGTQSTHGDLRFVSTWHYHLQESLRPIHFREADGSDTVGDGAVVAGAVSSATQPDWVTWSQLTHYHPSQSPNQLGKPDWTSIPTSGWSGKDDQHKSSNALNAAVATMDWPAYRSILQDEVYVGLENVRFKPGQSPGAPRAVGRRLLADANAYLLTGHEYVWERLVIWHAKNAYDKAPLPGPAPTNVSVQEIHYGDKPPFLCWATTNCVQGQHPPLPKIIVWQHGLLMKGLTAAWNTHLYRLSLGRPTHQDTAALEAFIIELTTTFVRHHCTQVNGNWQTWNYIAWNNGDPVDRAILSSQTETAGYTLDLIKPGNVWWDWHFPGYYYLARANHGIALPADVVSRLDSMATETEALFSSADFQRREWYPFTA